MGESLAGQFFHWLYGNDATGWLTLWIWPQKATTWIPATALGHAAKQIAHHTKVSDVYYGVGLRRERLGNGSRGESQHVCAIPGLWMDFDLKHPVHKKQHLPETIEDVIGLLGQALHLPPSLIIDSGHGVHVYWLFREIWGFIDANERQAAAHLLRRLHATIHALAKLQGWEVDSVFDLARVLRVPGTMNHKEPTAPKLVTIRDADPDQRYNPSDFEPYLIQVNPLTNGHAEAVELPDDLPLIDFRTLDVSHRIKNLILDGEDRINPEKSPSRSEALFGVLRALVSKGYDDSTIASVLLNPAYKISEKPLERGRPWLEQEIRRIRAKPAPVQPIDDAASISTPQHNNHDPQEVHHESDPAGNTHETISRLASLSPIAYDRAREAEAQALGIRVSTLDRIVAQARGDGEEPSGQGQAITFADDEETPWPKPVDGAQLLDTIAKTYRRYVVLPRSGEDALSLWTLHTHTHDVATVSPILALQSPQKRCGKTTTLQIVSSLVARALSCSNITPAAIFRTVERYGPTLILDEADTYLRPEHDEIRGILNSGHVRANAYVIRTVGDDHEPRRFSTWCPKAIALIGALPSTVADRSITLHLQRKAPGESVQRWRIDHADRLADLRRMAHRWAADHREALAKADPVVPASLHDRAADNWRPLLAIADLAGGDWPKRARQAIEAIEGLDPDGEDLSGLLLRDLRDLFTARATDKLTSADICESLAAQDDRPWPTLCYGKPITPHRLARMLGEYGTTPKQIRVGDRTMKGYRLDDLHDAFRRYTSCETETLKQGTTSADSEGKSNRNMTNDVPLSKSPETPHLTCDVSLFRFENGESQTDVCPTCGGRDLERQPSGQLVCMTCLMKESAHA